MIMISKFYFNQKILRGVNYLLWGGGGIGGFGGGGPERYGGILRGNGGPLKWGVV